MKKLLFIIPVVFLFSCAPKDTPEKKKEQLTQLKQRSMALKNKISQLEKELLADSVGLDGKSTLPVSVKVLSPEKFQHFIKVYGRVEAELDAFISPEQGGQIKRIHVSEGEMIKQGQLLVTLNTSVTESSIQEVKTGLELAEKLYMKQKELWEKKIGSELQFLEAKNAYESAQNRLNTLKAQLEMALIRAPFNGVVEQIMSKEGEMAMPGMQVMHVVNLKKISIDADVSESYLNSIKKGQKVFVSFSSIPGYTKEVPISRIGNVIEKNSRTFTIELKLDNSDERLKPNLISTVKISDFTSDNAIVIPSIIIKQDIQGLYVYVAQQVDETMVAQKTYITPGLTYGDQTMIKSGLEPDQKVIVTGYNLVSDRKKIRII